MNRKVCVVWAGLFALAFVAKAEDPVTVGFWTFDGTSGQPVVESRDDCLVPNRISDAAPKLLIHYAGSKVSSVPYATYTNEVQNAHLYGDHWCTNRLATTTSAVYLRSTLGSAPYEDYNTSHPELVVTNIGAAVVGRSFTLEFITKCYMPTTATYVPVLRLEGSESGMNPISLMTDMAKSFRTALYDGTTVVLDSGVKYSNLNNNHWVDDGDWHHIAIRWTEETKTFEIFTDYVVAKSATLTSNDLLLKETSLFRLFYQGGAYNHRDVLVQAVRLTTGDLQYDDFLQTSPHTTPQTTLAHYRFEGVAGETFVETRNLTLDRSDLALYQSYTADGVAPQFEAQEYPFLKCGGDYLENRTGVRNMSNNSANSRLHLNIRNARYFLPESFTHELIVKPVLQKAPGSGVKIVGERGGPHADTSAAQTGADWFVAQRSSTVEGSALYMVSVRVWNGTTAKSTSQNIYLETNRWHHLALTYDASTRVFKAYHNGDLKKTWALAEGEELARGTELSVPVGTAAFSQNDCFPGSVDEYRISNVALEPKDFLKMRKSGGGLMLLLR